MDISTKKLLARIGAVAVSGIIGYATNIVASSPTIGGVTGIVALMLAAIVVEATLAILENHGQDTPPRHARATGRRLFPRAWAAIIVVAILVTIGALVIDWNPKAFSVNVIKDPVSEAFQKPQKDAGKGINAIRSFLFPAGTLKNLPPPDGDCGEWYGWASSHGSIDKLNTIFAINVSADGKDTVQVLGATLNRDAVKATAPYDEAICEVGFPTTISYLRVNLDDGTQEFLYDGDQPRPLLVNIEPGKPEAIFVNASTSERHYRWYLTLDILVKGKAYSYRVDDEGKPFETIGGTVKSIRYFPQNGRWTPLR